jgi:hypothetical protein
VARVPVGLRLGELPAQRLAQELAHRRPPTPVRVRCSLVMWTKPSETFA